MPLRLFIELLADIDVLGVCCRKSFIATLARLEVVVDVLFIELYILLRFIILAPEPVVYKSLANVL